MHLHPNREFRRTKPRIVRDETFQPDVHVLPQPGVDAVRGGVFWDWVLLQPAAAGEAVEVIAGADGLLHFTQYRPGCRPVMELNPLHDFFYYFF